MRLASPLTRLGAALVAAALAPGAGAATQVAALADLSLEQLREIVVSTPTRRDEPLAGVPASVYVIGADEIRRSGATTLPEALRLAPQLDVARADANQYAISARGFDNVLANKMLVMIDGRTVYTPLFSGVFWEAQELMLDDVERIEVIAGPATALWGTNAVNGLVNVITRDAASTLGTRVSAWAGGDGGGLAARHGWRTGPDAAMRLYARHWDRSATARADGASVLDEADGEQTGLRADWRRGGDSLALSADAYRATIGQPGPGPRRISGASLLGRWQRDHGGDARTALQLYVDHTEREHTGQFGERLDTLDAVVQHARPLGARHQLVVGAGWRHARDRTTHGPTLAFHPETRPLDWSRLFAQDQWHVSAATELTLAASAERNPWSGTEWLPSVRLAHTDTAGRLWWAALSRAVRAPSRIDREFFQPAEPPYALAGGPDFVAERSDVLELGLREQATPTLNYAVSVYEARHDRLRSVAPTPAGAQLRNDLEGRTRGLDAWARWRPTPDWRLVGGLSLVQSRFSLRTGAVDLGGRAALGNDPRHHAMLRSSLALAPALEWDLALRRVGRRPQPEVPAYTAVDTRLAWRPAPAWELALVVSNLFDRRHAEWGPAANRVEFERSAAVQLRWTAP